MFVTVWHIRIIIKEYAFITPPAFLLCGFLTSILFWVFLSISCAFLQIALISDSLDHFLVHLMARLLMDLVGF